MKHKLMNGVVATIVVVLLLVGCASSTVESRGGDYYHVYIMSNDGHLINYYRLHKKGYDRSNHFVKGTTDDGVDIFWPGLYLEADSELDINTFTKVGE